MSHIRRSEHACRALDKTNRNAKNRQMPSLVVDMRDADMRYHLLIRVAHSHLHTHTPTNTENYQRDAVNASVSTQTIRSMRTRRLKCLLRVSSRRLLHAAAGSAPIWAGYVVLGAACDHRFGWSLLLSVRAHLRDLSKRIFAIRECVEGRTQRVEKQEKSSPSLRVHYLFILFDVCSRC